MGLRHGAKQLLEQFEANEDEIDELLALAIARIKFNPGFAADKIQEARDILRANRKLRDERLPEMLQKAAPPIQAQVDELRERIEALEAERKVIQLRREA